MPTTTIPAKSNDGYIQSDSATYATARDGGGTLTLNPAGTGVLAVGQILFGNFFTYESFVSFDTSVIPATHEVTSVTLQTYLTQDSSDTDFTITASSYDWGPAVDTADFRSAAQLTGLGTTVATLSTSGIGAINSYKTWVTTGMFESILESARESDNELKLVLYSSRHQAGNQPVGAEFIQVATADTVNPVRLVVTHKPKLFNNFTLSHCSDCISEHTFLVTNLLSGDIIAEVELSSFNWTEILNRPGSASATARIEHESSTDENFNSWANALWCLEGDTILYGGIIGSVQPRASSRVLNIAIHGFMEYYRTQPIQTTQGGPSSGLQAPPGTQWDYAHSYGGHPHKSAVVFDDVDQFRIFEDLVYHVGKRDSLSDIHPLVTYDELSGVLRAEVIYNFEYKDVGTFCEQLSDRDNGFFWSTKFDWANNRPQFIFYLNHNLTGVDREIIFEWDDEPSETILTSYDFGGLDRPGNSIIALGEGTGAAAKVARKESTTSDTTGGRPRYYEIVSFPDVKKTATLQTHADKYWNRHKIPYRAATLNMTNPEAEYTAFDLGDTVNLSVLDGDFEIFDRYRVINKDVTLTKEGDQKVTLGLEEPFVVFEEA